LENSKGWQRINAGYQQFISKNQEVPAA